MDIFTIHLALDFVIFLLILGFGAFGFRSFLVLMKYKELKEVRHLWLPVIASGVFFLAWIVEDLVFDFVNHGVNMILDMTVLDATLLVAVLLFSVGIVRFSRVWLEYARTRDEAFKENHAI